MAEACPTRLSSDQEIRNGDGGRMRVEIRPAARLRGTNAVDLLPALGPALDAVIADPEVDLTRLRVTADWVQYRRSFRPPVMLVPSTGGDALELAVDLRRARDAEATAGAVAAAFRAHRNGSGVGAHRTLEEWGPASRSLIWGFNSPLLAAPVDRGSRPPARATSRPCPGGESDARNVEPARELILELFAVWDEPRRPPRAARGAVRPGAGRRQRQPGPHLARRVPPRSTASTARRLLPPPALPDGRLLAARARAGARRPSPTTPSTSAPWCSTRCGRPRRSASCATRPSWSTSPTSTTTCPPTRSRASAAHLSQVETRAYLPRPTPTRSPRASARHAGRAAGPDRAAAAARARAARRGAARALPGPEAGGRVLARAWDGPAAGRALRAARRPRHLRDRPRGQRRAAAADRPRASGDLRMHVSNGAAASFADTLPLLHPFGVLQCHDLFVTDTAPVPHRLPRPGQVRRLGRQLGQRPPARRHRLAARLRRDVRAVRPRTGGNIVTLTARRPGLT